MFCGCAKKRKQENFLNKFNVQHVAEIYINQFKWDKNTKIKIEDVKTNGRLE